MALRENEKSFRVKEEEHRGTEIAQMLQLILMALVNASNAAKE